MNGGPNSEGPKVSLFVASPVVSNFVALLKQSYMLETSKLS